MTVGSKEVAKHVKDRLIFSYKLCLMLHTQPQIFTLSTFSHTIDFLTMADQSIDVLAHPDLSFTHNEMKNTLISPSIFKSAHMSSYNRYNNSSKGLVSGSAPDSLNRLMANRGSLHASFMFNIEDAMRNRLKQKKEKSDESEEIDYGYGDATPDDSDSTLVRVADEEPLNKKRRFQRRNSKTPAMLLALNSPILLQLDFLEDLKEEEKERRDAAAASSTDTNPFLTKDSWDGGLEIAEELVKHLQKRRQSQT